MANQVFKTCFLNSWSFHSAWQLNSAWLSLTQLDSWPTALGKGICSHGELHLSQALRAPTLLFASLSTLCFPKTILHSNAILCPILTTAWLLELRLTFALKNCTLRQCAKPSSDPESHPKVGFESVSGFGFRVSSIETNFRCRFRVSGFVAWNQLSLSVSGFGFRVSLLETNFRCRFRGSGFGFRSSEPTVTVGFGFRVSIGPGEVKSSESVSGFDRSWGR